MGGWTQCPEANFCDSAAYRETENLQNPRQEKPSATQRTTWLTQEHPILPSGIVPSSAVLPGWAGGPTASQVLWQQQGAHSREDKVCTVWRCQALGTQLCCSQPACEAAWALASASSESCFSAWCEQAPSVTAFRKRYYSKYLLRDLLFPFPHLSLLSYCKDESPFIIQGLSYLLAQQPHKAESSAEPEYSSILLMSKLHGNWKERIRPFVHLSPCKQSLVLQLCIYVQGDLLYYSGPFYFAIVLGISITSELPTSKANKSLLIPGGKPAEHRVAEDLLQANVT